MTLRSRDFKAVVSVVAVCCTLWIQEVSNGSNNAQYRILFPALCQDCATRGNRWMIHPPSSTWW